jgi:nitrite reductase/ring-hydroxylating ferredoxin subunit
MEVIAGRVEDIPPGTSVLLDVGRFGIGVFNWKGKFVALNNYCPHAGAPVCRGRVTGTTSASEPYAPVWEHDGDVLRCPWHGWEFWLETGKTLAGPARAIKAYPVHVRDGLVIVDA